MMELGNDFLLPNKTPTMREPNQLSRKTLKKFFISFHICIRKSPFFQSIKPLITKQPSEEIRYMAISS